MAIRILYLNLIIPIHVLEEKVAPIDKIMNWGRKCDVFHDDHLYHEGFMGADLDDAIDFWKAHGLKYDMDKNDGDFCVEDMIAPNYLPCSWLERKYNEEIELFEVWLKGKPKGKTYGMPK